jgi:hypothetical protein
VIGLLWYNADTCEFLRANARARLLLLLRTTLLERLIMVRSRSRSGSGRLIGVGRDSELAQVRLNCWGDLLLMLGKGVTMLALSCVLVGCNRWGTLEGVEQGHRLSSKRCTTWYGSSLMLLLWLLLLLLLLLLRRTLALLSKLLMLLLVLLLWWRCSTVPTLLIILLEGALVEDGALNLRG